jgi:hypothetical protein
MRRFVTAGALALAVALFAGCSDQETQTPTDPDFKKVSNKCVDDMLWELNGIHDEIDDVFMTRQDKRGAHQIVDNIGRKVCAVPPNYDATPIMAEGFYQHVLKVDDFNGGLDAAIALVARVFAFALDTPETPLPPEAFEPDGGVGVVSPETPDTIWTNNDEAAIVFDVGSFSGGSPVTVVLTRLDDPQPGVPGYPIPGGYQAYPEAYDFQIDRPLDGEAEIWTCVILDALPVPFENLVIGHDLGDGESELLLPPLVEDFPGQVLDCSEAVYVPVGPAVVGSAGTPAWLQLAGVVLEPIMNRVLDVKSLNAMYFAGKGLGGRTRSVSPFAPVDRYSVIPAPVIEFVSMDVGPGGGDRYNFTTTNWEDYPPELFVLTDDYGPCGLNPTPSRTWLEIYDASDDSNIYGFCGFDSPDDLSSFWFAVPTGQAPPDIYIELWDRAEEITYRSNTVTPGVGGTQYQLDVTLEGNSTGTVSESGDFPQIYCSNEPGADLNVCSGLYDSGSTVWLDANTVAGGAFVQAWGGDCAATPPYDSCMLTMSADRTVSATFTVIN